MKNVLRSSLKFYICKCKITSSPLGILSQAVSVLEVVLYTYCMIMKTINLKKEINLNFRDRIATIEDLDKVEWIEKDVNAFYNEETKARYFTFDAVEKIQKSYKDWIIDFYVPSKQERIDAVKCAWCYKELRDKLDLPYNGVRRSNGKRVIVVTASNLWSSTPLVDLNAYSVWFNANGNGGRNWSNQNDARSLVVLQV